MKFLDLPGQWAPLMPKILAEMEEDMKLGRFVGGPRIQRLEEALCGYTGFKYAIAMSSGTMALESVYRTLAKSYKSVRIPDLTFAATAFAAIHAGLSIEIAPATSPEYACLIEPSFFDLTIPVDLYGTPTNYEADTLYPLVIDACQSLGARVNGKRIGETRVTAAAVSFYPGKNLGSMGEGGALLTNSEAIAKRARTFINQGQLKKNMYRCIGTNGRMHALQAIPLFHGLQTLDKWNARRREIADYYDQEFAEIPTYKATVLRIPEGREPTRHVYPLFTPTCYNRELTDGVSKRLSEAGIPVSCHYPQSLHDIGPIVSQVENPVLKGFWQCPFDNQISLPIHPMLTEKEQKQVVSAVKKVLHA